MNYEVTVRGITHYIAHVEADNEDEACNKAREMWANRELDPYADSCEIEDIEEEY